eukprot:TRINITY_DN74718_c0_g1_i1.p1 TRINITY_DN74718_c0_g1~~TRINITY_DN74718_c0_g1_i1.p1  ORF type:complete len:437 (-),score=77.36 TRINITY_DN74718_c0_g1_i1:18-1328(-)
MAVPVMGAGPEEWVWTAIASGDLSAVRAAPQTFDVGALHPRYGSVLTAFLQALLNLEGRFIEAYRERRARELVEELGRRGARPDLAIPNANVEVKGLYRDFRLVGNVTALQAVIQMRNDLVKYKFERTDVPEGEEETEDAGVAGDIKILSNLVDRYAELASRPDQRAERSLIPNAVVGVWERCLADRASGDLTLVCSDGRAKAHTMVLCAASPVLGAMLNSGMRESSGSREVPVQETLRATELLLTLLYTGCLPPEPEPGEILEAVIGLKVAVSSPFMSNSANSILLPAGLAGEVESVDTKGDALIRFENVPLRQWVTRKNFVRLRPANADYNIELQRDLVGALSLAHCWQVEGLPELVAQRLELNLAPESFEASLEAALLQRLPRLRAACLAYAQASPAVRAAFEAGAYGPTVTSELQTLLTPGVNSRKRPREAL